MNATTIETAVGELVNAVKAWMGDTTEATADRVRAARETVETIIGPTATRAVITTATREWLNG